MENKPKLIHVNDMEVVMKFPRPPTQEEFDYWVTVMNDAVKYANAKTGDNIQITSIGIREES